MGFRAVKVRTSRGIRWASPTSSIARRQYGGSRGSYSGGGGGSTGPSYVKDKSGKKIVYTAGGQLYYKTTSGQRIIVPKTAQASTGWSFVGESTTGTPIWQKEGTAEFIRSDTIPSKSTKGIKAKVKGSVYFTSNPAFKPKTKDATIIYITSGGKTTGKVKTTGTAKSGLYAAGVYPGLDVTTAGGMQRLSKALTEAEQFSKYYTQQRKQELKAFKKAQKREQEDAIQAAIDRARATYQRRLVTLTKKKYNISDSQWNKLGVVQQQFYTNKFLTSLQQPSMQSTFKQKPTKRARYAYSLGERLAVKSPGVSALRGTTLKQRL